MSNRQRYLCIFLLLSLSACSPDATPLQSSTPIPPTSTPMATSTPSATSTDTPTSTPVPSGPCDNPLVPLVTGSTWEYRVTGSGEPAPFTLKALEQQEKGNLTIGVEIIDHKNARDIQEQVICQAGVIVNFPLYLLSMFLVDHLKGILNTYHVNESASSAPGYATFQAGDWSHAWEPQYLLEEKVFMKNPLGGDDLYVPFSTQVDLFFRAEGQFESVEVPAGSYPQALVVKADYHLPVTVFQGGAGNTGSVDIYTTQWYVPFLGLVRAQVDTVTLSYYGQVYSAPITSLVELISFTPGP